MNNPGLVLGACAVALGMAAGGAHDLGADFASREFRGATAQRGFAHVSGIRECGGLQISPPGGRSTTRGGSLQSIPAVILTL
jgi:hypothetical protein